jgi:hypothetical protein
MLRSRLPLTAMAALVLSLSVPALAQEPGVATPGGGTQDPQAVKESPYASAKDGTETPAAPVGVPGGGKVNPETVKDSPYAAAKDVEHQVMRRPDRQRLWWLLLPSAVAALVWSWLRRQEQLG